MKNFALVAFSIFASAQLSCADLFDDMVGKWKVNGVGSGNRVTVVFKRLGSKGLTSNTTIVIPGIAKSIGVTRYNANGTFRGTVNIGGTLMSTTTGTWRVNGRKLIEKGKIITPISPTPLNHNVTATVVSANRINTLSVVDGERNTGSLTRLR